MKYSQVKNSIEMSNLMINPQPVVMLGCINKMVILSNNACEFDFIVVLILNCKKNKRKKL